MAQHKNGVHTSSSQPPSPAARVRLTEREQRWRDEFAAEGVHIVRTVRAAPAAPAASSDPAKR
jgi:hypothetical protein